MNELARRVAYRVGQFRRAVGARPCIEDTALLARLLSPDELRLFWATSSRDQHHHLETLRLLRRHGQVPQHLARAALLHDIGKGRVRLYERVLYVLLAAAAPRLLAALIRRERPGPLGALYRIHHHPRRAVALLRPLGASQRELELILRHHEPPGADAELNALIAADHDA
ncbi:MAG: phosphohydrolase [Chloroflexota bacterium]